MIPESLLIWAENTTTTSEYGNIRKPLVATRTNEEWISSATSFSSFPRSKDQWTIIIIDEVNTREMIIYILHIYPQKWRIESHTFSIFYFNLFHFPN